VRNPLRTGDRSSASGRSRSFALASATTDVAVFNPNSITGLKLWVKGDAITGLSDGDPIATWADNSSANNDATASGSARPTYKTNIINGLPVARFDNIDDAMTTALVLGDTTMSIFLVYARNFYHNAEAHRLLSGSNNWLFGPHSGSTTLYDGGFLLTSADLANGEFAVCSIILGSDVEIFINGASVGSKAHGGTTCGTLYLGALGAFSEPANCDLAELIIYDNTVSGGDKAAVEAYLATKYGL
jgi:hypothetical protein